MSYLPILVCSKGRPNAPVFPLLREAGLLYRVVVEPQDFHAYIDAGHTCLCMDHDDRGLAYARQYALDIVRYEPSLWYWMLDDDLSRFYRTAGRRNVPVPIADALSTAERLLEHLRTPLMQPVRAPADVGIVALEYSQYAWSATPGQLAWNSYCDCAVLIRSDVLADYRLKLPLKVDRDFTLQVIASGTDVVRLRSVSFQVPRNGSNKGGLHDRYADGIEETASRRMEELWPGVCEYKMKPNGRPDTKIHWKRLRNRQPTLS